MEIRKCAVLAIGLLISAAACANVVYEWQTVSTSETISGASGRIEFMDTGWSNYRWDGDGNCTSGVPETCPGDPTSPVVSFIFDIATPYAPYGGGGISLWPVVGNPLYWWSVSSMDISFNHIYASNSQHSIEMSTSGVGGGIWTISRFGSDSPYYGSECGRGECSGASGIWRRVPEPATIGLLGLGLLSFVASLRRAKPLATSTV